MWKFISPEMDYSRYSFGLPIYLWVEFGNQVTSNGVGASKITGNFMASMAFSDYKQEDIKVLHYCDFVNTMDGFPSQRASNTRSIPMSWHLHAGMLLP